jgi:phosphoribosyl 1,2-cyclic phosphodiesterase
MSETDAFPGFRVTFWGTRGSIPTPGPATRVYGGNTSCVELRAGPTLLICDAGTGLRELGLRLSAENGGGIEGHLFLSHAHWDHIQGFPFFPAIYDPRSSFRIYEVAGAPQRHHKLLSGQMSSDYFPVAFSDLGARVVPAPLPQSGAEIADVSVSAFLQRHPGGSFAYSFERDGTKVVYATDCELDLDLPDPEAPLKDPAALREVSPEFVAFVKGADLLIIDSQYLDEEYPTKVGWGHPRATTAIDAAIRAEVKQVALFHHDPMHSDQAVNAKVALCRKRAEKHGANLFVFGAREGLQITIDP